MKRAPAVAVAVIVGVCAMRLGAAPAPVSLARGPFLQSASDTSVTIVWRTDSAASGTLRYGRVPGPAWESEQTAASAAEQAVVLTGLRPDTRYYYEVVAGGSVVATGPECSFRTCPSVNSRRPFTFLAWGDSGTRDQQQYDVAANMRGMRPRPELALMLGDNVYDYGEDSLYDASIFTPYGELMRNMAFWPTLGNHDAYTSNEAPFITNFHLPSGSGAAGHPSNTERYYSFDYGCAHFVCLDPVTSSTAVGGAMYSWLADDLDAANARGARWTFVFMHYPPYTKGSHDSDTEGELIDVRNNLCPLMESRGVDMVFGGHSHSYERSFLARNDAIYQTSVDDYSKIGSSNGTIYVVSGCGGQIESGSLDHPLMAFSRGWINGNSIIDVGYDECRGYFMLRDGTFIDEFTLRKATDTEAPYLKLVESPSSSRVSVTFNEPLEVGSGANGAANPANYSIDKGISVTGATLLTDGRTVVLSTSAHSPAVAYTLTVRNVRDRASNAVAVGTHAIYTTVGTSPVTAAMDSDVESVGAAGTVSFSSSRSIATGGTVSWDFGDGSATATTATASHTYTTAGFYTATLTVTDSQGAQAVGRRMIFVQAGVGSPPTAVITASATTIDAGGTITFDSAGSVDPDGGTVTVEWNFGDPGSSSPNSSTSPQASHTFNNAGQYTVTLTVTDNEGLHAIDTLAVTVTSTGGGGGGVYSPPTESNSRGCGLTGFEVVLMLGVLLVIRRRM